MNDHFSWISALLRAFYSEGVRHVYLSPGSRSTPLTLAAAVHPGFKKTIVLDERSAAFQALGTGKKTGVPALLICTSGTAVANYMPAVVEAKMSGTPLIILSADRPPFKRGIGSSQTIDQIKLFGDYAVFFHELGEPVHENPDIHRLDLLAKQAASISVRRGGAAHLNIPFRKPLEPNDQSVSIQKKLNKKQVDSRQSTSNLRDYSSTTVLSDNLSDLINQSTKPLIIAGPDNPYRSLHPVIKKLTDRIQAPLLAEPGANLPDMSTSVFGYDQFLRDEKIRDELKPDLLIRVGNQPFSQSLTTLLNTCTDNTVIQFLSWDTWQDETITTDHRLVLESGSLDIHNIQQKKSDWLNEYQKYESLAANAKGRFLVDEPALTDGHVVDHLTKNLSGVWDVMLSNSFIVRDFSLFSDHSRGGNTIITNRGAAGIDGIVSTAAGVTRSSDRPMLCITGDLAFLHDSNALLSLNNSDQPFVIVVINNGGGTIFRMLPVSRQKEYFNTYFETPHNVTIQHLASAYGIDYKFIDSKSTLKDLNLEHSQVKGTVIIECKTDPDASMDLRNKLWHQTL